MHNRRSEPGLWVTANPALAFNVRKMSADIAADWVSLGRFRWSSAKLGAAWRKVEWDDLSADEKAMAPSKTGTFGSTDARSL